LNSNSGVGNTSGSVSTIFSTRTTFTFHVFVKETDLWFQALGFPRQGWRGNTIRKPPRKIMHITTSYLEVPCVHKSESEAFATIRGTHGTWWSGAASAAEPEERANRARDDADSESYVADFS
jgi:hypothetical protein